MPPSVAQQRLSRSQIDLLSSLDSSYLDGLTTSSASRRRSDDHGGALNTVPPPLNCPKWVCCLLPCIKSIPSMKLYRQINPEDAEVRRDGRWVRYDAASLVRGDVIRLTEGDTVPADCAVLSLGMDHVDASGDGNVGGGGPAGGGGEEEEELVVDLVNITGRPNPITSSIRSEDGSAESATLYYGGQVLRGSCIAIVTAVGPQTLLARLIREKRWPPDGDLSAEIEAEEEERSGGGGGGGGDEDGDASVSLIDRAA